MRNFIADWLLREDVEGWPDAEALVAWAEPFGGDARAAWDACPRADFLIAIAGAHEVPADGIVREALAAARAVSGHARKPAVIRRALTLAETGDFRNLGDAYTLVRKQLVEPEAAIARYDALKKEEHEAFDPLLDLLAGASAESMAGTAPLEDLLEAALGSKTGRAAERAFQRVLASLREPAAARAACAAVLAVVAHALGAMSSKLEGALTTPDATDDALATATKLLASRAQSQGLLYRDAANAIVIGARCGAWTADAQAWARYAVGHLDAGLRRQSDLPVDLARVGWKAVMDDASARAIETLGAKTAPLRASLAWPLGPMPPSDAAEARRELALSLRNTLANLRLLGDAGDVIEAVETALAVLRAPGPLDRSALAPALRTFEERLRDLHAREAARDDLAERDRARAALRLADFEAMMAQGDIAGGYETEDPS